MPQTNILIADDTTLIRYLLAEQLNAVPDFHVVGTAEDGREAVDLALKLRPDVIVMDLDMPHLNGIFATERIRSRYSHIQVILLTAHNQLGAIGKFSGAFECLNKSCTPQELIAAIRRARTAARDAIAETKTSDRGTPYHTSLERVAQRASLTEREKRALEKIVTTEMTAEQIARALSLEMEQEVTVSSVKHAIERAAIKLRVEPRTRSALVKYVLEFDADKEGSS